MKQRGFGLLAYLVAGIALAGLVGTGVYRVKQWGYGEAKAECLAEARAQREREAKQSEAAATKKEAGDAKAKILYRTITRDVDKVVTRVEYQRVCFDDDGLRLANAALSGKIPDTAKPHASLFRFDGADRWFRGNGPSENSGTQ